MKKKTTAPRKKSKQIRVKITSKTFNEESVMVESKVEAYLKTIRKTVTGAKINMEEAI